MVASPHRMLGMLGEIIGNEEHEVQKRQPLLMFCSTSNIKRAYASEPPTRAHLVETDAVGHRSINEVIK